MQVSAVVLYQLYPAAIACIVGGSIVNQTLGCFCFTHANVTIDVTGTGTNFATIHVYSGYVQMNVIFESPSHQFDCTMYKHIFRL